MRIKGHKSDDVEQGRGIGLIGPIINLIPNNQNQRRPTVNYDEDTSEEEVDLWLFAIQLGEEDVEERKRYL